MNTIRRSFNIGVENTLDMYDSNEWRKLKPTDICDDTFIRALDESGFVDGLYGS